MPHDADQLVRDFIAGLGESTEADIAQYRRYLAAYVVWDTGTRVLEGIEACVAHLEGAATAYGVATWSADILHQTSSEGVVLNERVDHVFRPDGSFLADLRVMGVFEVAGGAIRAWRDYYDPSTLMNALKGKD